MQAFDKEKESQTHEEFLLILPLFRKLIQTQEDTSGSYDILEEMISLRASFLLDRVFEGMHMDFDKALNLLRNNNEFISLSHVSDECFSRNSNPPCCYCRRMENILILL